MAEIDTAEGTRLELTTDEVDVLIAVLRSVGGDPQRSRRKHTDSILFALEAVRPGCSGDDPWPTDNRHTGSITFPSRGAFPEYPA